MSEKKDIMSLNQQVDAQALIKEIDSLLGQWMTDTSRVGVINSLIARYKEKWPDA